jgi:hypothetical protein
MISVRPVPGRFCGNSIGDVVRLEVLDQLKNPITSSGIEYSTFRLNQLRYRVQPSPQRCFAQIILWSYLTTSFQLQKYEYSSLD